MIEKINQRLHITVRQIETFVAIGRCRTTYAASQMLSRSQSAVSASLGELETLLSLKLFDRKGRYLELNDYGRYLMPLAYNFINQASALETAFKGSEFSWLRLGASYTLGEYVLPQQTALWRRKYPSSHIELKIANSQEIMRAVSAFELDAGFIEGTNTHADLFLQHWFDDELKLFCAPEHPLVGKRVEANKLHGCEWVMRERGSGTREAAERILSASLGHLKIANELGSNEAVKKVVAAGVGIGCLSVLALRDAFQDGSLKPLRARLPVMRRAFSIVLHRNRQPSPAMEAFITQCKGSVLN
jgi:DNA-binding transcriptional LysR family regulator